MLSITGVFGRVLRISEAATGGVLSKSVLLKISQNSQENTCDRVSFLIKLHRASFLIKLQTSGLELY